MSLAAGKSLAHYEVLGPLGAGGMGEVYLAKDTRLGREVAIKVLPEDLADDAERLHRFEREARTLASLNHTNIAGIHGVDQEGATYFLALELVPGEDLAERLKRGALPVDEALDVCRQIAEGLEAAHEAGVVHRDLKPANIRITPDGVVKLLDFGLAKPIRALSSKEGTSPAESDSFVVTSEGMILGTPTYMSPEQARGKPVDRRTDIWAFGCVLYECLTGKRAFAGEAFGDLVAAILEREADLGRLPAATPAHVRRLIERALTKDPRTRLRDIGEARIALSGPAPSHEARGPRPWLPWAVAGAATAAAALFAWRAVDAGHETRSPTGAAHAGSELPAFVPRTFGQQTVFTARFMPDGQNIVYSAARTGNRPEVFLLQPGAMAPRPVAPAGTLLLSVSSQGELAILTDTQFQYHRVHEGTLARMTLDGSPRALIESVRDADWGPDGELAVVRATQGFVRLEYPPGDLLYETTGYVSEPRVSPDGARVAFLDHQRYGDDRGWVKVVDRSAAVVTLSPEYVAIEGLAWTPDGQRLLFSGASAERPNVQPRSVGLGGDDLRKEIAAPGELVLLDVAPDGRRLVLREELFYGVAARPPGAEADVDLSWLDQCWGAFSAGPDSIVYSIGYGGSSYTIVRRRLDGSPITALGEGDAQGCSPDGRWVMGLLHTPAEIVLYPLGVGTPRRLERGTIELYHDAAWFPDGRSVLLVGNEASRPTRCFRQSIDGGPPEPVTDEGIFGALSPRGDRILTKDRGGWMLYPLDGGAPRAAPGLGEHDVAFWGSDGVSVHVHRAAEVPLRLERVDLETGERSPSHVVGPEGEVGIVEINLSAPVRAPGEGYCYSYKRRLSQLFVVEPEG